MTKEQAITILKEHNKWRRGTPPYDVVGNRQPYSAKDIGLAIDCVVEELEGISGNQREIPPKFDADYLQSKIDAHTKYMQEHGLTTEKMLEDLQEGRSGESIWHKASEELPKEEGTYLLRFWAGCSFQIFIGSYRDGKFGALTMEDGDYVTHWMEIPEPPKED